MRIALGTLVMMALLFGGAWHARFEHRVEQHRRQYQWLLEHMYLLAPALLEVSKAIARIGISAEQAVTAFRSFSTAMRSQSFREFSHTTPLPRPTVAPIGDIGYDDVDLEKCWRCDTRIPRDDDLGLCVLCVGQLQSL